MAAIVAALLMGLRILLMAKLGAMVARVLLFFGITWATNKYALQPALDQIAGFMNTAPSGQFGVWALGWAGVMKLDVAVSMLLSAMAAAWTIKQARVFLSQSS